MPQVQCPKCKTRLDLDQRWAGKKGTCPNCRTVLCIPGPSPSEPLAAVSPGVAARAAAESPPQVGAQGPEPPPLAAQPSRPRPWLVVGIGFLAVSLLVLLTFVAGRMMADRDVQGPLAKESTKPSSADPLGTAGRAPARADSDRPSSKSPDSPGPGDPDVDPSSLAGSGVSGAIAAGKARPKIPGPASGPREGLVGVSRRYDDLDCQRVQNQHGIRVPRAATIIEVDGLRLPIADPSELAAAPAPVLLLPRGVHAVRFRPDESPVPVTIETDLYQEYQAMRQFFDVGGTPRNGELMSRGARAMDVHAAPFLLSFMGASHAAEGRWAVAERKFRRALVVNPTFSPAHLNLAECLVRRNEPGEAARECELAEAFNVQNVFGLAAAITQFRRKLGLPIGRREPVDVRVTSYVTSEPISEEDRRITALLEGISKYAVDDDDRGKILNNLAIHFADTDRPRLALYHFRNALAVVKIAGPERFELASRVFSSMSRVCRKAGFEEAVEYEQMQHLVSP